MSTSTERATLAKIALATGVSISTVSKVVNGRPDVAPVTRSLVQQVLLEHSYAPRRADHPGRSGVSVLFHGPLMTYSLEILEGVLAAATGVEVDVVVARTDVSGPALRRIHKRATRSGRRSSPSRPWPVSSRSLSRAGVPTVVIDPVGAPRSDVISVGSTNFAGGLAATEHLLGLGHRRIAYVGGTAEAACNQARLQGFRGAMEAAGVRVAKAYTRSGNFEYSTGLIEGAALLDLAQPPTAIFTANDEIALGVIEAARTRGLRVPHDLSVVGFDDTEVARVASPQLTTVAQPLRRMGAVAFRTALRLSAGEHVDSHHVELATELVVRGSTAPPPA